MISWHSAFLSSIYSTYVRTIKSKVSSVRSRSIESELNMQRKVQYCSIQCFQAVPVVAIDSYEEHMFLFQPGTSQSSIQQLSVNTNQKYKYKCKY